MSTSKAQPSQGFLPNAIMVAGLDHAPYGVLVTGPDQRILYANPAACLLLGYSQAAFLAMRLPEFQADPTEHAFEGWQTGTLETTLLAKDGGRIPVEMNRAVCNHGGQQPIFLYVHDLSARRSSEAALKRSEHRYALAFNASPDAINLTRLDDGTYLDVSAGFERITGWKREEVLGRTAADLDIWADLAQRRKMLDLLKQHGEFDGAPFEFRRKNGTLLKGLMSGRMVSLEGLPCLLTITRDVTLQVDTQQALRQSQKLESLGVLAGGIAHDFNNLLTAIMGNLNLAQLKLPENAPALPHLEAVETTVLKASELTRQMLAYAGKGRFAVRPQDLNALITDMLHLLKVGVNKKVSLEVLLAEDLPAIEGDAAQIQQVLMNLVTNASESIVDREGTIRVGTGAETLDAERAGAAFPVQSLESGLFVVLDVEDTGCGMSPDVLARIFDPFFTTKVKGRGLGLSAMLGILKGHKAGIRVTSTEGAGSRFRVYFPASRKAIPTRTGSPQEPARAFSGKVLLVDDEIIILDSIGPALEAMGFEVVQARDGLEALERFEASAPSLVIMDLTMPRMDGATAFARMREARPGVPVILSSGYDRQALEGMTPAAFVQKPYRIKELRKMIAEVLAVSPS